MQIVKKFEPNVTDQIQKALHSLATSKAQVFTADRIVYFVTEFENLQMPLPEILDRIRAVHYKKTYGEIQFSDFVDINLDDVFPSDVIFRRALLYIQNNFKQLNAFCLKEFGTEMLDEQQKARLKQLLDNTEVAEYDLRYSKTLLKAAEDNYNKAKEITASLEELKKNTEGKFRKDIDNIVNQSVPAEYKQSMLNSLVTTQNLRIFNMLKEI